MTFDQTLLKEIDWMTVERKKEILFLNQHRERIDHFEFLECLRHKTSKP